MAMKTDFTAITYKLQVEAVNDTIYPTDTSEPTAIIDSDNILHCVLRNPFTLVILTNTKIRSVCSMKFALSNAAIIPRDVPIRRCDQHSTNDFCTPPPIKFSPIRIYDEIFSQPTYYPWGVVETIPEIENNELRVAVYMNCSYTCLKVHTNLLFTIEYENDICYMGNYRIVIHDSVPEMKEFVEKTNLIRNRLQEWVRDMPI